MRNLTVKIILIMVIIMIIGGCGKKPTKRKMGMNNKLATVRTEKIALHTIPVYTKFSAKILGIRDITLLCEAPGKVVKLNKKLGDFVKKDEEIGEIDNEDYVLSHEKAKNDVDLMENNVEITKLQFDNAEALFKEDKISKIELLNAKKGYLSALSARDNAKSMLFRTKKNLEHSRFLAPISGYITDLFPEVGQFIGNGKPIAHIVDYSQLKIKTGFSSMDINNIKKGMNVEISSDDFATSIFGKVTGVGFSSNTEGIYPVEMEFPSKKGKIFPGMIVEGRIITDSYENVIALNISTIVEEYGKNYVYEITENSHVKKQLIEIDQKIGEHVIIKTGLQLNDEIVVTGKDKLNDKMKVKIIK